MASSVTPRRALAFPEVVPYLLERGALDRAELTEEGVVVRDLSSRHRNYSLETATGGLHLKQGSDAAGEVAVAREALLYREFANQASLEEILPRFIFYDPEAGVLALARLGDARDLRTHHLRAGRFPAEVGAGLGEALARIHAVPIPAAQRALPVQPSFLYIYQPSIEIFRTASAANLELIRLVQNSEALCAGLDMLKREPHFEALLHNDIKWDNCLLTPQGLALVDWEVAGFGDPAWDLGSVFGQYLSAWIFSIPASSAPPENFAALAAMPLSQMKMAVNACWTAYFTSRLLSLAQMWRLLHRAVAMTAVRLLQSAFEASQFAARLTSHDILHLQLANNILATPRDACRELLGLPLPAGGN